MVITSSARWVAQHELWFLAASAPFLLFPNTWTPLAVAAVAFTWLCRWIAWGSPSVRTPADAPLAILLLTGGVSLYASVDPATSLPGFWRLLLGVVIYYGLVNGVRDARGLRLVMLLLAFGGLGLVVLALLGARWELVRLINLPQLYDRLPARITDPEDGLAIHPRVLGMALATLLPVLAAPALFSRDRPLRSVSAVAALAMALVLPLTQALGALAGACAGLFVLAVWRSRWFLLLLLPVAGLAAWATIHLGGQGLAAQLLSITNPLGIAVALRLDMWSRALAVIRDLPFTGIGFYTFPAVQSHFYPGYLIGPEPHAHNVFLQVGLDLGLPGLLAFVWLFVAAAVMAVQAYHRQSDRDDSAIIAGLCAGLVAYLVANQIDTLWHPKLGVLLWVLLGLLAAIWQLGQRDATSTAALERRYRLSPVLLWMLPVLVFAASALLFSGAWERNLGILEAQKAVFSARSGGQPSQAALAAAENHLRRALDRGYESPGLYSLLGSVLVWQEDYPAALTAFEDRVMLDGQGPAGRYIPYEALRRRIVGEPEPNKWDELYGVYAQWMTRFPQRAENYLCAALVRSRFQANPAAGAATLKAGLEQEAQPRGVLEYFQPQLSR